MSAKPVITAGTPDLHLPGFTFPARRLSTGFLAQQVYYRDNPAHDDAWVVRESAAYGGTQSIWWRQNEECELIAGGEPVWPMLRREVHVRVFTQAELADWAVWRSLDHGMRHHECCAWCAVNREGDRVYFRQYYARDKVIEANVQAILRLSRPEEYCQGTVADPAIWKRDDVTAELLADVYARSGLALIMADNGRAGYDAVARGFLATLARWTAWKNDLGPMQAILNAPGLDMGVVLLLARQPAIWFTPEVAQGPLSLYEQCVNFRWKKQSGDPTQRAPAEDFVDVDDEGPDVVRYAVQSPAVKWQPANPEGDKKDFLGRMLDSKSAEERRAKGERW